MSEILPPLIKTAYLLHEYQRSTKLWFKGTQIYRVDPFVTVNYGGKLSATPHVIVAYSPKTLVWNGSEISQVEEEQDEDSEDFFDPFLFGGGGSRGSWEHNGPPETTVFAGHHKLDQVLKGKTFRGLKLDDYGAELLEPNRRVVGRHDPAEALRRLEWSFPIIPGPPPKDLPFFNEREFVYF